MYLKLKKWSELTAKASERDKFLKFLKTDERGFRDLESEAQPIVDYIESRIGGKNYWQVSYDELRSIYAAVKLMHPKVMIETGVGPGTTSTAILTALRDVGGKLVSFDLGEKFGEDEQIPVGEVVPRDLKGNWNLVFGDSSKTLPEEINKIAPVDIFFHDSDHTYEHVTFELETFYKHASERFLIIIDNFNWSNAPYDFCSKYGLTLYHIADDMCFIFRND